MLAGVTWEKMHRWQGEETNWTDQLGLFVQLLNVQLASPLELDY